MSGANSNMGGANSNMGGATTNKFPPNSYGNNGYASGPSMNIGPNGYGGPNMMGGANVIGGSSGYPGDHGAVTVEPEFVIHTTTCLHPQHVSRYRYIMCK